MDDEVVDRVVERDGGGGGVVAVVVVVAVIGDLDEDEFLDEEGEESVLLQLSPSNFKSVVIVCDTKVII